MTTDTPLFPSVRRRPLARALAAIALVALAGLLTPAKAQRIDPAEIVQAQILPGWETADGRRMAALHLRLAPGWHTYWRVPGEAGIAPRFDWSRSQNLGGIRAIWPRPEVYRQNGYMSFIYENELVLPLELIPDRAGRPIALMAEMTIGVCRDACVPVDLSVQAALRGPGEHDARIDAALEQRSRPAGAAGLRATTCRLEPQERGALLTLRATLPPQGRSEQLVVELPGTGYWVSDSATRRDGDTLVAEARLRAPGNGPISIDRGTVFYTVLSEDHMVAAQGCTGG